ncbi:hypothetical protein EJ08DRAFT_731388 [Tothia fuscella]|uniref:Uncharacterized protein n=1 Tax=Tothia fuscella TaxID=1048955 RepID=A0A9P4U1H1_9PEZI|nr:hypothetical protein EJ08DRAFT_731388 [Tothia fuscella]
MRTDNSLACLSFALLASGSPFVKRIALPTVPHAIRPPTLDMAIIKTVTGAISGAGSAITGATGGTLSGGSGTASGGTNTASGAVSGAVGTVGGLLSGGVGNVVDGATDAVDTVVDTVTGAVDAVGDTATGALDTLGTVTTGALDSVVDTATGAIGTVSDVVNGALGTIVGSAQMALDVVDNALQVTIPAVVNQTITAVNVNLGNVLPSLTGGDNPGGWNCNSFCSVLPGGAGALCKIPISSIPGTLCDAVDYFLGAQMTLANGATAHCSQGSCYRPSCLNLDGTPSLARFSRIRFDCSGTIGAIPTPSGSIIPPVAIPTPSGSIIPPIATPCPAVTGLVNAGPGVSVVKTLLGAVTNLFTCTQVDLLTGTNTILNIKNAQGNLVRVGTVFIKLNPDKKLVVKATADAGYDLVNIGVNAKCGLLGLPGVSLNTCSAFGMCNTLPGNNDVTSSGVIDLAGDLTDTLKCILGSLQFAITGTVRKLVLPGQTC